MIKRSSPFLRKFVRKLPDKLIYLILAYKMYFFGEPECRILKYLIEKDKTAIDVGANRGAYSYWMSKYTENVIAFEPIHYLSEFLCKVTPKNVSVINSALSDHQGTETIYIPLFDGCEVEGETSLSQKSENNIEIGVQLNTLDSYEFQQLGFIKIDVEGHELNVLRGAKKTLLREKPIILVECEQRHLSYSIDTVFDELIALNFVGYFLKDKTLIDIQKFEQELHQDTTSPHDNYINNFLFFPRSKVAMAGQIVEKL